MDSERKGGIALIINNKDNRPGSEIDVQKLKTTLEKLNARVETVEFEANAKDIGTEKIDDENLKKILNLPKTEKPCALAETVEVKADGGEDDGKNSIAKIVAEFIQRTDFSKYTWTAIALFSHGLDNEQILEGKKCLNVQKILLNQLIDIDELKGRLKWVILQACRGLLDVHTASSDKITDLSLRDKQEYYIKSYSSQEGCKSYRPAIKGVHQGSFYINSLCENLDKYAKKEDLLSILRRTTESVQKYSAILRFEKAKKAFADSHDTAPKLEEDKKATADSHDTTPKLEEFIISVENDHKTQWPQYETNLQLCKFFFDKGIVKPPPVTDNSVAKDL